MDWEFHCMDWIHQAKFTQLETGNANLQRLKARDESRIQ